MKAGLRAVFIRRRPLHQAEPTVALITLKQPSIVTFCDLAVASGVAVGLPAAVVTASCG